jgi:hypothetical protein
MTSSASLTDLPATDAALRKAGKAAVVLEGFPIPRCADPHGYWKSILAHVKAAGDDAGSGSSSLGNLIIAEVPLKKVPGLETKLTAELKGTTAS